MEFMEVVKQRYSVRKFDSRPVDPELIQIILETARMAPTAVNRQPQRLLVLQSPDDMEKLAQCTKYTFGAPAAIIVGVDESAAWVRPYDQDNSGVVDASIVATHIMLAIRNLDLGSCWVGHFDPAAIRTKFNFPPSVKPVAVFPFGYPAADCQPGSRHFERLPIADLVWYNTF